LVVREPIGPDLSRLASFLILWSCGFVPGEQSLNPTKSAGEIWDFARPLRNIPGVEIMSTDQVEVYHVLHYKWVVMVPNLSRRFGRRMKEQNRQVFLVVREPIGPDLSRLVHCEISLG
jgi:hypothetical protein